MTDEPHLLTAEEDGVFVATLNRPEKLNALSDEMMALLERAVLHFRDSAQLRVMLIRSTGRYFSAGADLIQANHNIPQSGSAIREIHRVQTRGMRRIYDEMEAIEKPFVVAHHATCMGGGLEMSLSCDFRLAARSARYAFPEGKFGVLPASNGVSRLTRIIGPHWARYLVAGNFVADAQKALIMGLIHEVFPDETFESDVMAFCRHLSLQNAEQFGAAKIAIELAADLNAAQAGSVERLANSALMLMPGYQEGMTQHLSTIGGAPKQK